MMTATRLSLVTFSVAVFLLTGCPGHSGGPEVRSGNDLILDKMGIPSFVGKANRCPGSNDGDIQKSWDSGKKRVKGKCKGGVMVGTWKAWYENGATQWKADFEHGLIVGTFKSWYQNDEDQAKVGFKEGVPHGDFKAWWRNGEVRTKGEYVGGKKNGCWKTWHKSGDKASKGTYADGKKVLTWLYWSESGKKRKEKLGGKAAHGKCLITF